MSRHKVWLKDCRIKTFKKLYGSRVGIDGRYYSFDSYKEVIKESLRLKVGDKIYNIYKNIWEPIKRIDKTWERIEGTRKGRYLEITFITELGYRVYDINDRDWEIKVVRFYDATIPFTPRNKEKIW